MVIPNFVHGERWYLLCPAETGREDFKSGRQFSRVIALFIEMLELGAISGKF